MAVDPQTAQDWQEAVDLAHGAIALHDARLYGLVTGGPVVNALHDARLYGLVTGGPVVNVERCEDILARGKSRGVWPSPGAIDRFIAAHSQGGQP